MGLARMHEVGSAASMTGAAPSLMKMFRFYVMIKP